jgi:phosphatidylglycerophosphatase A
MSLRRIIASGLGAGFLPKAPGTWGSLLGLAIGALLIPLGPAALFAAALIATATGFWAIEARDEHTDPGWVVIDEVAGQLLACLPLRHVGLLSGGPLSGGPLGLVLAFALFRAFDIAKPGPIRILDRRADRIGIMTDDLAAGLGAALVLWAITLMLPALK